MKHVHFIRGRNVVRVTVPEDLREIIGKRELAESLDGDKRMAHGVIAGFLDQLERGRDSLTAQQPTLSSAAKAHYATELVTDDKTRVFAGNRSLAEYNAVFAPYRASLLRLVAAGEIVGDEAEALIGYAADDLTARGLAPATPRPDLLRALAEVQLDALARFEERDKGTIALGAPQSPLLTSEAPAPADPTATPSPASRQDRSAGKTLSDVLTAFHGERTAGARTLATKTMSEHTSAVRMFEEFIGYERRFEPSGVRPQIITKIDH